VTFQVLASRQLVSDIVASSLLGQSTWLALGMALAVASVAATRSERESRAVGSVVQRPGLYWIGALASLGVFTALLQPGGLLGILEALNTRQPVPETLVAIVLTGAMSTLFVLPAVFGEDAGGLPRRILAAAPIAWLGLVSYGLFLWHLPIAQLLALSADPFHFSASGLDLVAKIPFAVTPTLLVLTIARAVPLAAAGLLAVVLARGTAWILAWDVAVIGAFLAGTWLIGRRRPAARGSGSRPDLPPWPAWRFSASSTMDC